MSDCHRAQDFPEHKIINRAFGGNEICDSTHYPERMIFHYEPKMIFLRAGGSDIQAGKTPEQLFADYKDLVAKSSSRNRIGGPAMQPSLPRSHAVN